MSIPYSKRKEYFKRYREAHREKMSEYVKKCRIKKYNIGTNSQVSPDNQYNNVQDKIT
jgi:hypothetical protein